MTPENIEAIKEALAPVADKIGQGAEYAWEVLVWGQFAEGVMMLVGGVIGMLATGFVVRWGSKRYAKDDFDAVAIFAMALGAMSFIIALIISAQSIIPIVAPEYAALKFLISLGS